MKKKDLIIVLLLVGLAVLTFLYVRERNLCKTDPKGITCNVKPSDSCCVDSVDRLDDVYSQEDGCFNVNELYGEDFIEKDTFFIRKAILDKKKLNKYKQIYGYQIDIFYMKQMLTAIEDFDKSKFRDTSGNILTVKGVRFYEAVTTRMINGKNRTKADLVMIPYLSSGHDVFKVDYEDQPFLPIMKMYTHFRPCPRLCSTGKFFIHQE